MCTGMAPVAVKALIDPGMLEKVGVRVGTIQTVAGAPSADKLVQLRIAFGDHARTIVRF